MIQQHKMEVTQQIKLSFHGVDIMNVNYNSQKQYNNQEMIDFSVSPKVFYPEDEKKQFKILMDVNLKCKEHFELTLVAIGHFELDVEIEEPQKKVFVNLNAPAIMFPYVRSFITTLTSNLGNVTVPIILPTQFFNGEMEELKPSVVE
jgi:preprotein translocase subunit SecB